MVGSVIFGGGDRRGPSEARAIVMALFASAERGGSLARSDVTSPLSAVSLFCPSAIFVCILSIYLSVCLATYVCMHVYIYVSLSTLSTDVCLSISLSVFIFYSLYITLYYRSPASPYLPPPPVGGLSHCCSIPLAYIMLFHRARLPRF